MIATIPVAYFPVISLAADQVFAGVSDVHGLAAGYHAGIPLVAGRRIRFQTDEELEGGLAFASRAVLKDPGEARLGHVDTHGIGEIFAAQSGWRAGDRGFLRGQGDYEHA